MIHNNQWKKAYIALGSNLGDRTKNFENALHILKENPHVKIIQSSGIYETEPVDMESKNLFYNSVVEITTDLSPRGLLELLLETEAKMGRDRKKGMDRNIDLDLLYYEGASINEKDIVVPHPRFSERRFVLEPWAEIAPDLMLEPLGKTVSTLLNELP